MPPGPRQDCGMTAADASTLATARARVDALGAAIARAEGSPPRLVETAISWVLLGRELAHKIKKPVRLPYLDFTSLAERQRLCEEELRINRRFAPELYLDVVEIRAGPEGPSFDARGPVVDFAVRMRRFPDGALWSERIAAGTLAATDIDAFARRLAAIHGAAPAAAADTQFGSAAAHALVARRSSPRSMPGCAAAAISQTSGPRCESGSRASARGSRRTGRRACERQSARVPRRPSSRQRASSSPGRRPRSTRSSSIPHCAGSTRSTMSPSWRWICSHTAGATWRFGCSTATSRRAATTMACRRCASSSSRARSSARRSARSASARGIAAHGAMPGARLPAHGRFARARRRCATGDHARTARLGQELRLGRWSRRSARSARAPTSSASACSASAPSSLRASAFAAASTVPTRREGPTRACTRSSQTALAAGWPTIVDAAFLRRDERAQFAALAGEAAVPFTIVDCRAPLALLRAASLHARRHAATLPRPIWMSSLA